MKAVLLKITPTSARVATVLENLRKKRKQPAFVLMALEHYLNTEEGVAAYCAMAGVRSVDETPSATSQGAGREDDEGIPLENFFRKK